MKTDALGNQIVVGKQNWRARAPRSVHCHLVSTYFNTVSAMSCLTEIDLTIRVVADEEAISLRSLLQEDEPGVRMTATSFRWMHWRLRKRKKFASRHNQTNRFGLLDTQRIMTAKQARPVEQILFNASAGTAKLSTYGSLKWNIIRELQKGVTMMNKVGNVIFSELRPSPLSPFRGWDCWSDSSSHTLSDSCQKVHIVKKGGPIVGTAFMLFKSESIICQFQNIWSSKKLQNFTCGEIFYSYYKFRDENCIIAETPGELPAFCLSITNG